jgi:hypothetical protein
VALAMSLPRLLRPIVRTGDPGIGARRRALGAVGAGLQQRGFWRLPAFRSIPTFIDGRIELFGNAFLARYLDAANGGERALSGLLDRWGISWTLLSPEQQGAVGCLDRLSGWRRTYTDARRHPRAR